MLDHWLIVIGGGKFLEDVRRAPDDQLSGVGAAEDVSQLSLTCLFHSLF